MPLQSSLLMTHLLTGEWCFSIDVCVWWITHYLILNKCHTMILCRKQSKEADGWREINSIRFLLCSIDEEMHCTLTRCGWSDIYLKHDFISWIVFIKLDSRFCIVAIEPAHCREEREWRGMRYRENTYMMDGIQRRCLFEDIAWDIRGEQKYVKPVLLGYSPDLGYPTVESITPKPSIHQQIEI